MLRVQSVRPLLDHILVGGSIEAIAITSASATSDDEVILSRRERLRSAGSQEDDAKEDSNNNGEEEAGDSGSRAATGIRSAFGSRSELDQ